MHDGWSGDGWRALQIFMDFTQNAFARLVATLDQFFGPVKIKQANA